MFLYVCACLVLPKTAVRGLLGHGLRRSLAELMWEELGLLGADTLSLTDEPTLSLGTAVLDGTPGG